MSKKTDRKKDNRNELEETEPLEPISEETEEEMEPDAVPDIPENKIEEKAEPEPRGAVVPLAVFIQLSGRKLDQVAGFKRFALNQKLEPRTIPEWREKLVEFDNRPMR